MVMEIFRGARLVGVSISRFPSIRSPAIVTHTIRDSQWFSTWEGIIVNISLETTRIIASRTVEAMSLASFIQRRRYELDITQEDLEERTGLRQSYLSQLERGAIRNPRGRNLEALARGLEVSVDDLKIAMGYVVQVDREVRFRTESHLSAVAETSPPYTSQPPSDPRQRLFLKKTTEKPLTDAQWEKLLAILDEEDESEG